MVHAIPQCEGLMVHAIATAQLTTTVYAERQGKVFGLKLTYSGAPEELIKQLEVTLRAIEARGYDVRAFEDGEP